MTIVAATRTVATIEQAPLPVSRFSAITWRACSNLEIAVIVVVVFNVVVTGSEEAGTDIVFGWVRSKARNNRVESLLNVFANIAGELHAFAFGIVASDNGNGVNFAHVGRCLVDETGKHQKQAGKEGTLVDHSAGIDMNESVGMIGIRSSLSPFAMNQSEDKYMMQSLWLGEQMSGEARDENKEEMQPRRF